MPRQTAKNVQVAYKVESTFNTPPGATSAEYLRYTSGSGLNESAATIRSNESRADSLTTMGRNGSRSIEGSYGAEASVRSHDTIYEAILRGTWASALVITEATSGGPTSITTTTSKIVGNTGSWITAGLRVGDVIRLTDHATAANCNRNLRIKSLSATEIEVFETLTLNASADSAFTITRGKKLVNGTTPTKRTFYVEQNNVDIDGSQLFGGVRWTGFTLTGSPDGMAELEFTALGVSMAVVEGASAPYFTSPTAYNSTPLTFADASINVAGTDIAVATAFELQYTINAALQPVIGSTVSPDVFDNDASLSGSFSMIREDFDNVAAFRNETEFALHILLTEAETEPKDYLAFFVPRCKYTGANATLGGDGAMIESLPFQTGAQAAVTGYDAGLLTICTSAAA